MAFFALIVYPVILIILGLRIVGKDKMPRCGPALIVANHNSHLDTIVLMCLMGLTRLHLVRPVAAADYFLQTPIIKWFSQNIIGIIPISRERKEGEDPLEPVYTALNEGKIVLFFPEGSRGEPEKMAHFKKGITHLIVRYPRVPITPVFMHGLGKSLPKGDGLLVPFFCDIFIGEAVTYQQTEDRERILQDLETRVQSLKG